MEKSTENEKRLLVLSSCGYKCCTPLSVSSAQRTQGEWVKAVAYMDCISFCDDNVNPQLEDELDVNVEYPVCCREGEAFSATIGDDGDFITLLLLKIKKNNFDSAILRVKVLSIHDRWTFVKPVAKDEIMQLSNTYNYKAPMSDIAAGGYSKVGNNTYHFSNSMGGGDIDFDDYIYTDKDGVDHLIQQCYRDFEETESYYGDKVLGLHKNSPYFAHDSKFADGTKVPDVPFGFTESLTRVFGGERIVKFLRDTTIAARDNEPSSDLAFESINNFYTDVYVDWVGRVGVEGFLYAVKKMIENQKYGTGMLTKITIQNLYNEMARVIASKSYDKIPVDKYLY